MQLVQPGVGIVFWMLLSFGIVFIILKVFAWKPILSALKDRENSIAEALRSAEKAKEEMTQLQAGNEKILQEAIMERDRLIKEARELKEKLVSEAKAQATAEAAKVLEKARENIMQEKEHAFAEIKTRIAEISIQIAEKLIRTELAKDDKQRKLIEDLVKELKMN